MPPQASPPPASPQAATGATTAATAPVAAARVALVAGATGLVGRAVLARLLADKSYSAVHCVGRRTPAQRDARLTVHLAGSFADFKAPPVDDVFIALGTTIKTAGSREAFRAVDFDAVLAVARSARIAGATRLGLVSAMGADAHSALFYTRVKGEAEEALSHLGFSTLVVVRPSFLSGERESLGQPPRAGEKLALGVSRLLGGLIPANYQSISAERVAQTLVEEMAVRHGHHVILSGEMQRREAL
ncbi:NAD-dependent epimerase/dehydratase family protein [Polaromonas sp. SP1]|nr:NAD-dependent epimerase/dehydratase family protein [Polaromonas sp. SP1]